MLFPNFLRTVTSQVRVGSFILIIIIDKRCHITPLLNLNVLYASVIDNSMNIAIEIGQQSSLQQVDDTATGVRRASTHRSTTLMWRHTARNANVIIILKNDSHRKIPFILLVVTAFK